jgi:glyoxylase-like metal-dependent hydrolase (beta-lactamase superfamily II)
LAGDLFHVWDNWEKRLPMDDMNFSSQDPVAWFQSWDRIKAYADMNNARVIPSHDYKYLQTIPWEYH